MQIFINTCTVIFLILGIFLMMYLISLVFSISGYFDARKKDIVVNSNRLATGNLLNKCEATSSLIALIDTVIEIEIREVINTYLSLNSRYEINRVTNDAETISRNVYNSIKKEVFLNDDSIFTEEYLMTYITNIVTMNFISRVRDLNLVIDNVK